MNRILATALPLMATVLMAGCASYSEQSLPERPTRPQQLTELTVDVASLPYANLRSHRFDASDGLDQDEVAILAIVNNPQLRLARDDLKLARAQSFAAGLLPDPQLNLSSDRADPKPEGGSSAYSVNLSLDIMSLLQHASHRDAAAADLRKVNLNLLWQEWQVQAQARLLFVRVRTQEILKAQLQQEQQLLAERAHASAAALLNRNVSHDTASADQIALQAANKQLNDIEQNHMHDLAGLHDLLGLAQSLPLHLVGPLRVLSPDAIKDVSDERIGQGLRYRPDILALRAGYESEEQTLRSQVLAQFPLMNIGMTRARDTSNVSTLGFGLALALPVLNGNRGAIAIETATRQRLFDEYQVRWSDAISEIQTAAANLKLLSDQERRSESGLQDMQALVDSAQQAVANHNLTGGDHVHLVMNMLDRKIEIANLEEALAEQEILITSLLGPEPDTARAIAERKIGVEK